MTPLFTWLFYPRRRKRRPAEGPLSLRSLRELSLFSMVTFVFSALLIQLLLCAWMMLLLNHFNIHFRYGLFHVSFFSESGTKWSEEMIMLVFGSGHLLMSVAGVALLLMMKNLSMAGWKTKLVLTWISFLMVNALPCGILAGAIIYDGFGVAFAWLVNSFIVRGILALLVLALLVFTSRFWYIRFLKTAFSMTFFNSPETRRTFFFAVYLRPWIMGIIILMTFTWPFLNWYWPVFLLSLGYLAIIMIGDPVIYLKPMIKKSDKQIFANRSQLVIIAVLLVLIWVAGIFRINF